MFKEIDGYPDFLISEFGDVYSLRTERLVKLQKAPTGYVYATLRSNGGQKRFLVHRLVAKAYIPNPENRAQVNHINGIKDDNRLENIEWCTPSQNLKHAHATGLFKFKNPNMKGGNHGNKHTQLTKAIMSAKKIGENHPRFKGHIITPYGKFGSSYEAAIAEGVTGNCIRYRCKTEKFKDYFVLSE